MRMALLLTALFHLGAQAVAADDPVVNDMAKIQAAVLERAAAGELVRVLVEVQVSDVPAVSPEGDMPRGVCANVDCAKLVVSQSLTAEDAPLVEPLADQPLIVMEVSAKGLEALAASPLVARVTEDALSEPFDGGGSAPDPGGTPDLSAPQ